GLATLSAGKFSSALLAYKSGKTTFRRDVLEDNQVGAFVLADNARIKRGTFNRHSSDAIILLGDTNLVATPAIDTASVDGCFVNGNHNLIRGGWFTNLPIGIWFYGGDNNSFFGMRWGNVPFETEGVYGGVRPVDASSVVPFQTACTSVLSCDDG